AVGQGCCLAPINDQVQIVRAKGANEPQTPERETKVAAEHQRRDAEELSAAPGGENAEPAAAEVLPPAPLPFPRLEERAVRPRQQRVPLRPQRLELLRPRQLFHLIRFDGHGGGYNT